MDDYERSRRNHPSQRAADKRAWEAIVAGYHAGLTAEDPHDKANRPDYPIAHLDENDQITFRAGGHRISLEEATARKFHRDIGRALDNLAAKRLAQGQGQQ